MIEEKEQIIDQIMELAEQLLVYEKHCDSVAQWYSIMQIVSMRFGKKMLEIRTKEQNNKKEIKNGR